ncbi:MAG: PEP-CTERM sorting domain-containing protein, partial [Verrucomicrobia bacterium]|nr:PEP-CTERM sorting domain-containing protein [Verrucomicrobiota bacterium]
TGSSSYGFTTLVSSQSRSVTLSSLDLNPDSAFYLRWHFNTTGSNSQGLGLDNFSLTASAVPEPSTYAAIAGAAALLGAAWHRRRLRRP